MLFQLMSAVKIEFQKLNTVIGNAGMDADNEGLTNLEEFQNGTNPRNSSARPIRLNQLLISLTKWQDCDI